MTAESSVMVAPGEGEVVLRGGVGVIRKISSSATGGTFSVVEHPLEPGALAAPPHTHAGVDEYSFVIEGEIGVLMGEETFKAAAHSYVLKPRGVPHTFWNPGPKPARVLEIISPASFEEYFEELAGILSSTPPASDPTSPGSWGWPAGTARFSTWSGWRRSRRSTACSCGRRRDGCRTGLLYDETIGAGRPVDDHRTFAAARATQTQRWQAAGSRSSSPRGHNLRLEVRRSLAHAAQGVWLQRSHLLAAASRLAEGRGVARAASRPPRQARKTRPHRLVSGIVGLCQLSGEKGGEETGPNPVDRGRPGSKRHLLVDGDGLPLSVILTGANVHDSMVFEELIEGVEPIQTPSGRPRRRPDKIHADKGYDFPRCRSVLRQRGIKARIARRGLDSSERLGRHR
jgi:mannose-6-phosphate isomerase-like protein (cupin superfamily)